tara:strand:+ start:1135 stop:1242 length:108 start_codon:yes stop_codon:yes gene_type:complete
MNIISVPILVAKEFEYWKLNGFQIGGFPGVQVTTN